MPSTCVVKWQSWIRARPRKLPLDRNGRGRRTVASEVHGRRKQWQRNAFTNFTSVPKNPNKIGERADDREQEEMHLKVRHPKVRRNAGQLRVLGRFNRDARQRAEKDSSG